jgi:hypothetical protein
VFLWYTETVFSWYIKILSIFWCFVTLQIVYLETAYRAQMQKILPSNQIVAKKLQHIFQLIKIQSIAHYILYGLHELPSRNTAEDRCLDRIFLSFSRYYLFFRVINCIWHLIDLLYYMCFVCYFAPSCI